MNTEVEEVTETSRKADVPSVQDVLIWAKSKGGVVLSEWVNSPMVWSIGRIVVPAQKASVKGFKTSEVIREAINAFYPHLDSSRMHQHSCVIQVSANGKSRDVWILESNLQTKVADTIRPDILKMLDFPSYPSALKNSRLSPFLGVTDMLIQN